MFNKKMYPPDAFAGSVIDITRFKTRVQATSCPNCTQPTLQLNKYTVGKEGFEAEITCKNCNMTGTINTSGFEYKGINRKPTVPLA